MNTNEQVLDFIKANPNSNKAAITAGTGIKGLPLFNLLKKLVTDGQITSAGEGNNMTYTLNENYTEVKASEENAGTEQENEQTEQPGVIFTDEVKEVQTGAEVKEEVTEEPPAIVGEVKKDEPIAEEKTTKAASTTRDNSKYKFNGEEYGKGPLVRAVVAKYVEDHPDVTYKQLKEVFPDTLMKRFGVFASESEAKKLSGNKPRYFLKPEQMIKIKGLKEPICVTNQWTATLILPFIECVRKLGIKIQ